MYKSILPIILLALASACASSQEAAKLNQHDIKSVAKQVYHALATKDAQLIEPLVSPMGTAFVVMGTDTDLPSGGNREEIVGAFKGALADGKATCVGYDPSYGTLPDKAIVYLEGIDFKSSGLDESSGLWGLQFVKDEQGIWWLTWITPVSGVYVPQRKELAACGSA